VSLEMDESHWSTLAEKARSICQHLQDPVAKRMMLAVVDDYLALAKYAASDAQRTNPRSSAGTIGFHDVLQKILSIDRTAPSGIARLNRAITVNPSGRCEPSALGM
jgi:hypothetical protein